MSERTGRTPENYARDPLQDVFPVLKKTIENNPNRLIVLNDNSTVEIRLGQNEYKGSGKSAHVFLTPTSETVAKIFFPRNSGEGADHNKQEYLTESELLIKLFEENKGEHIARPIGYGIIKFGSIEVPCIIKEHIPTSLEDRLNQMTPFDALDVINQLGQQMVSIQECLKDINTPIDLTPENIGQRSNGEIVLFEPTIGIDINYSAPEYTGKDNSPPSEASLVYSLALIYYHFLTGYNANEDDNTHLSNGTLLNIDLIDSKINSINKSEQLKALLTKALQTNPASRQQKVTDFILQIKEVYNLKDMTMTPNLDLYDR